MRSAITAHTFSGGAAMKRVMDNSCMDYLLVAVRCAERETGAEGTGSFDAARNLGQSIKVRAPRLEPGVFDNAGRFEDHRLVIGQHRKRTKRAGVLGDKLLVLWMITIKHPEIIVQPQRVQRDLGFSGIR